MRVVSLLSSATEIVCALGAESLLVGRSHECDFPVSIRQLPQCSQPGIDISGTSREIDLRVKSSLQQGLSIYQVNADQLQALRPDVILTQTQCEVCAVSLKDVESALCHSLQFPTRIISLESNCLTDFYRDVQSVANALNIPERGAALVDRIQSQFDQIRRRAVRLTQRPKVACLEWLDPLMAAGNWVPELVEISGGINLFGTPGKHSPWMTWDELTAADPDVIVAMPCGWDISKSSVELEPLTRRTGWADMQAVRSGSVFVVEGNQYFNRPGPRLTDSAEILAEIFYPEEFRFGHHSTGWVRFR